MYRIFRNNLCNYTKCIFRMKFPAEKIRTQGWSLLFETYESELIPCDRGVSASEPKLELGTRDNRLNRSTERDVDKRFLSK